MTPISQGFRGHPPAVDSARVPPGQHVVEEFPVLSVGSTPHTPVDAWTFQLSGAVDQRVSWTWEELLALPAETPAVDIHCVTAWSKLATIWRGVSVDTLLEVHNTHRSSVRRLGNRAIGGGFLEPASSGECANPMRHQDASREPA